MVPGTGTTFVIRNYSKIVNLVYNTKINTIFGVKIVEHILAVPKTFIFNIIEIEELFLGGNPVNCVNPGPPPVLSAFIT